MIGTTTLLTPDDCFAAAKRRFDQDPRPGRASRARWSSSSPTTTGRSPSSIWTSTRVSSASSTAPLPAPPSGRVTIGAADLVLFAKGILDEHLLRRRGLLHIEGDMYVLGKLPTLLVTDVPLYQFRTGDVA